MVNPKLQALLEQSILPLYDHHDKGHDRSHAEAVIENSMEFCAPYSVNPDMVYTIAVYHDAGLREGRETHHLTSARMLREDKRLQDFFTEEQIACMAEAVEDHRASGGREPRSLYGKIISEADRIIDPEVTVFRCMEYGKRHYPELDFEGQVARTRQHLEEKYGQGGYIKLWLHSTRNEEGLRALRALMQSDEALRALCKKYA